MTTHHDFQSLRIVAVDRTTPDAVVVTLAVPPGASEAFRFLPGQHMAFRAMLDGQELRRTYSICSGAEERHLRVAVRRIADGWFSAWANTEWQPGQTLDVMPPAGRFVLPAAEADGNGGTRGRHLLAFAAGAGITPVIAMLRHVMRAEPASRFTLVYGNRTVDRILFRQELEDLKDSHLGRLQLLHVLSGDAEVDSPLLTGRIGGEKITELTRSLLQLEDIAHVFLCGPGTMIREGRDALLALGLPRERMHWEFFAPGGGAHRQPQSKAAAAGPEKPADAIAAEVVAILDGSRRRFTLEPGETVIDGAIRAGLRVPYSCKGGMCSTCRGRVREGAVTMKVNYSLEPWELTKGFVLTCQSLPTTPMVVIDYDEM